MNRDPRRVEAQKLESRVQVRFAETPCTVQTMEGSVLTRPGDAILTGSGGEKWRVSRMHFPQKYRPVPPTVMGHAGVYAALPRRIAALKMDEPFEVWLADGESRLEGQPGDWLVDYGDGSLGIVAASVFAASYKVLD